MHGRKRFVSGYGFSGQKFERDRVSLHNGNHKAMHGRKRFTGALVPTPNIRIVGDKQAKKACLLFFLVS